MTTTVYLGIIVAIIIIAIVMFRVLKTPKKKKDVSVEYTTALNYLILGDKARALERLREAVLHDTSNVDAYLKIGDILRDQGMIERAVKIHQGLIIRHNLTSSQKIEILKSLIKDYQVNKRYDRAVSICEKLLELTHDEIWAQEIMLTLYEDSDDWDRAFDAFKKIQRAKGEKKNQLLALYKVEAGLKFIREGQERDGRIKFREAMKLDKKCPPAYLYLSDSYIRENRYDDALTELKKFVEAVPHFAHLGFNRIKDILYHEGSFGDVEDIFQSLLQKNPENEATRFSLADIYERKGEVNKSIDLCHEALERNPDSIQAKRYLAKYLARVGENEKALDFALDLIENLMQKNENQFNCKKCDHVSPEPKWRCPQCHEWNSFLTD